jgi:hypothetical protein
LASIQVFGLLNYGEIVEFISQKERVKNRKNKVKKEMANSLHEKSPDKSQGPFHVVSISAIPNFLI